MTLADSDVYYDPYDFDIDTDPYPVWKRLRDEKPLYYNDKHDFYALSRWADVESCSSDWKTYISSKGTLLELIKMDFPIPPGSIIFEDPPDHDVHRAMLSRVFRPKKIAELEPKIREFCARALDPMVGAGGFDFIANLGAEMPMRTIGYLLGIPEQDQVAIREAIDASLRISEDGKPSADAIDPMAMAKMFEDYVEWRAKNPSDDLMTEMLNAEFEDVDGTMRKLNRDELLGYINLIAAAGNETTTRLIGWTGKVLAEHPDQRAELVANPDLIPNAIEELLRYEAPSPVQARYVTKDVEHYGQTVPAGNVVLLLTASANRDERKFPHADAFDIHRKIERHLTFGYGVHFCLGASLARLEGRIALDEVLKRFPTWDVDYDRAVQARTSTVRGWETLPVITS
ncbi:MAG TPA: cytochrome P450 [Mycobacteriales bacterium]|nr:cytochrome P450 [Mycobacteriales bacterium]